MHLPTIILLVSILSFSSGFPLKFEADQLLPTSQTVKQDILNIHNAVLALDANVQSFTGAPFPTSLIESTPVLLGVAEIHKVNRVGFVHAIAAASFSVQDSVEVIDTVVATVDASIPNATKNLKTKAAAFKASGFAVTAIASLKLLLYDHDTFSAAVLSKTNVGIGAAKIKEANDAVGNIHEAIQDAIIFYEKNAG